MVIIHVTYLLFELFFEAVETDVAKPFHEEERWVAEDEREVPVRVFFLVENFQESSREQKEPFSPRT